MAFTVTNVADFHENLERAVKDFDPRCERLFDTGLSEKWGLYDCSDKERPYLLIVSRGNHHAPHSYDTILSVTSNVFSRASEIRGLFAERTGIELREAPEVLQEILGIGGAITLGYFRTYGPVIMGILKKGRLEVENS